MVLTKSWIEVQSQEDGFESAASVGHSGAGSPVISGNV